MENRRSSRKPLHQRVSLHSPRIGSVSAYARDVSLGGMFVETGPLVLPPNADVAVSFFVQHNGLQDAFHLHAMVVRREPAGAGLMFLQMDTDAIRRLSDALSRHHEPGFHA